MERDYSAMSDEELTAVVDVPGAFAELESRYLWLIRLEAGNVLRHGAPDREDLIQEGLLGLYHGARSYRKDAGSSFKTYAGKCIFNRMSNEARNHRSKKNSPLNHSVPLEDVDGLVPSPERDLELREDFSAVLNQIHISLSVFEKKVLALYLSGYKRSEIPLRYGISVKAFDNAVQRVRRKLKAHSPSKVGETP